MRDRIELQTGWTVSISAADAILAASRPDFQAGELERADDPETHPQTIDLPGGPGIGIRPAEQAVNGHRYPNSFLSYAKKIAIPTGYRGQRVFLYLDKVRYHVTVSINGRELTHYVGGWEPHRFDITDFVVPGEDALLLITVGDTGVSGHRVFDPYNYTGTRLPACEEITNNLVHPVAYGGADRAVGKVAIEAVPPVRTEWVFANPKVGRGVLEYSLLAANDTDGEQEVRAYSEARGEHGEIKLLLDRQVKIAPHSTLLVKAEIPWADAVLWDTDTPHLYQLHTRLSNAAEKIDEHHDYFGFREFTINGHSYYLNGRKIHLLGSSGHITETQNEKWSVDEKIGFFKKWMETGNVNHVRLHARPKDKTWVEAADRCGMLIATESALWTTGFYSFDWAGDEEGCYQNVSNHILEGLVRRDRNNPSVVIWSFSNEMSPITPYDLENPKMASMTRTFEKIIAQAKEEDDSRVIQMSSAMDFIGKLDMLNLHYPKNWQAFPDYPRTAYWLDEPFLFPWYGLGRAHMPAWSWRRDKPLYIGEFSCIFGPTPDSQAGIVGDAAFEDSDGGTARADAKLWPLEINAYRRQDVSGFCAWAAMFGDDYDVDAHLQLPHIAGHSYALRHLAVLDHSHRTQYFGGDEAAFALSAHNDTRTAKSLEVRCELREGDHVLWSETMPAAVYQPGENLAWTSRVKLPEADSKRELQFGVKLTADGETADEWSKAIAVHARAGEPLPASCAFFDPEGTLEKLLAKRGIGGGTFLKKRDDLNDLGAFHTLWINFDQAKARHDDDEASCESVARFLDGGGCVVFDHPTPEVYESLPVPLKNGKGFAPGELLEITYGYNIAPHHPVTSAFSDADLCQWGEDAYLAHRCFETPLYGNATPLVVAGADLSGLTLTALVEIRAGRGSFVVSSLDLFPKMLEAPVAADMVRALASYRPRQMGGKVGVSAGADSLARYKEVGLQLEPTDWQGALNADVALIDGETLPEAAVGSLSGALQAGKTVYLHKLTEDQTRAVLSALNLPGTVKSGATKPGEYDVFRHTHRLADGMTNNYIYWTTGKATLAAWTAATLHPEPASAVVEVENSDNVHVLTRRGAVAVYQVGAGTLVIDNLNWQLPDFDEPERPRRYVMCLLTNLGVPLGQGSGETGGIEFETAADRRERGHF